MSMSDRERMERDSLGTLPVPADKLYGIQTVRAMANFPVTGRTIPPAMIRALGLVKKACARANMEAGLMPKEIAEPIIEAADEVARGIHDGEFPVDPIQGGAGTSTNMNANEVIANRALDLLGKPRGSYDVVHPNGHVNMSQSTNDVIPTAFRVALLDTLQPAVEALGHLADAFAEKGRAWADVLKVGRTHLQDAVPIRLGSEFTAYARVTARHKARLEQAAKLLLEVNLGATAVGTGLNAPPAYSSRAVELLAEYSGYELWQADDLVDGTQNTDAYVEVSGALRAAAVSLSKIASDLRLLASGPAAGLAELRLPEVQPGSSIMPGKVNPVMPELINQVAFHIQGNDLTIALASQNGQLELNVMEPIMMHNLFDSAAVLGNAVRAFTEQCVKGIEPNLERLQQYVDRCIAVATVLNPYIGYDEAASVAKESLASGRSVKDIVLERGLLSASLLDEILAPERLTRGDFPVDSDGR